MLFSVKLSITKKLACLLDLAKPFTIRLAYLSGFDISIIEGLVVCKLIFTKLVYILLYYLVIRSWLASAIVSASFVWKCNLQEMNC